MPSYFHTFFAIIIDRNKISDVLSLGGTTRHGYNLESNLKNRVQVGSPDFQVRLVTVTTLHGYESSNFLAGPVGHPS